MTKQVTYNNIVFLHHEETYEVRKNQTGTIKYYTRIDTGESGMSLRGLSDKEIRKLKYQPIYEKTHQAHLYAQWGGICLN